jgi:hypothetical protein
MGIANVNPFIPTPGTELYGEKIVQPCTKTLSQNYLGRIPDDL